MPKNGTAYAMLEEQETVIHFMSLAILSEYVRAI